MIAFGSDHAGFRAKTELIKYLREKGFECSDYGTLSEDSCDYPDFAVAVSESVAKGESEKGVLICGTGIGMSITANKVNGVRCALCCDAFSAEMSRRHNDANVLAMGARVTDIEKMKEIADIFLTTAFEGGRHQNRVDKITKIEKSRC